MLGPSISLKAKNNTNDSNLHLSKRYWWLPNKPLPPSLVPWVVGLFFKDPPHTVVMKCGRSINTWWHLSPAHLAALIPALMNPNKHLGDFKTNTRETLSSLSPCPHIPPKQAEIITHPSAEKKCSQWKAVWFTDLLCSLTRWGQGDGDGGREGGVG